ncbi:hypothetical protein J6590_029814 [Homalodisca vitripennis]|nr:hypothetical protein J6590_029814 [Homalodisca vitripennis]
MVHLQGSLTPPICTRRRTYLQRKRILKVKTFTTLAIDALFSHGAGATYALQFSDYNKLREKLYQMLVLQRRAQLPHLRSKGQTQDKIVPWGKAAKVRGVSQGSCLGPILFTFYTAVIFSYGHSLGIGNISPATFCRANGRLNDDLESLSEWSVNHCLKLNPMKCSVIYMASTSVIQKVTGPLKPLGYARHITSNDDIDHLYKLENIFMRLLFNTERQKELSSYRDVANLMQMEAVCGVHTCSLVTRVLTLGEPQYLTDRLILSIEVVLWDTRQNNQHHIPGMKLEIGKKNLSYFALITYKYLPCNLKVLKCSTSKSKMKTLYANNKTTRVDELKKREVEIPFTHLLEYSSENLHIIYGWEISITDKSNDGNRRSPSTLLLAFETTPIMCSEGISLGYMSYTKALHDELSPDSTVTNPITGAKD